MNQFERQLMEIQDSGFGVFMIEPVKEIRPCPFCKGEGCEICLGTGELLEVTI